jgi:putative FmdB family regulatory protein
MPLYEYECESCGVTFEVIQKFSDHSVDTCRACGGKVRRLLSAPAIQFKGTGWYITDYARKGKSGSESEKSAASSPDSSAASSKTDSTTDSKADSKTDGKTETSSDSKGASSASSTSSSSSTTSSGEKK